MVVSALTAGPDQKAIKNNKPQSMLRAAISLLGRKSYREKSPVCRLNGSLVFMNPGRLLRGAYRTFTAGREAKIKNGALPAAGWSVLFAFLPG